MSGIKTCFVLEPGYEPGDTEAKRRLDLIYNRIIEPSIDAHNFRIIRSSELAQPEFISRDHITLAASAELLIADVSGADPVVFYCLAHRMAAHELSATAERQPVIVLVSDGDGERFYLTGPTAYPVRYSLRPDASAGDESAKRQSLDRKLVHARRDLTQAVRRRLALQPPSSSDPPLHTDEAPEPAAARERAAEREAAAGSEAEVSLEDLIARAMRGNHR